MSRGLRNKNPLNIRRSGEKFQGEVASTDPAFKQFTSMAYGYRAAFKTLDTYRRKYGCRTLVDFINRWAPPSENNTAAYIRTVANRSGIAEGEVIDTRSCHVMRRIVSAMAFVENGVAAEMEQVRLGWQLFIQSVQQ